jgi:RNA polymerase sigma-70 factor (ECF subfamily)
MQAKRQDGPGTIGTEDAAPPLSNRCLEVFLSARTEESFNLVCQWLAPQLLRYFRMRGCENAAAEELTQDVLFAIFREAGAIRDHGLFRGWVFKVAKNALLQRWRKSRRSINCIALDFMGPHPPEATVMPAISDSGFEGLIAMLAPEEREILTLRFVDGLDYREISAALDIPVGTAKWRIFNSKLKLAAQMKKRAS